MGEARASSGRILLGRRAPVLDGARMIGELVVTLFIPIAAMALFRLSLERLWPVDPARRSNGLSLCALLLAFLTNMAISPGARLLGTAFANRLGGGLVAFPARGPGVVAGFLAYFLLMELVEYLFHRAEHVIPWLWSQHSLHHADEDFDSTTAVFHHWTGTALHAFLVNVPMGLLFKVPNGYLLLYLGLSYHVYLMHSNLKLDFGRFSWLLTSPSYHRLHHSSEPQHFNRNYAFILPIFDVLFGSYRPARTGEWPKVGLGAGQAPQDLVDLFCWPVRDLVRARLRA
jgi:sterol desaturase/sphingolipid hydroxylase (fatty acid hydroxylase superfamily)